MADPAAATVTDPDLTAGPDLTADLIRRTRARAAGYESRFNARFAEYFDTLAATMDAPAFSRFTPDCLRLLRELSLRGGKRMRVVLLHEAARLVTGEPVDGLDAAALSIELLQTHGLIHDDIIDDSPVRRGGPSTYYAYRERFPHRPRTALGLAVLAGDLALALSLRVLLEADVPLAVRQAMVEAHTRATANTFVGQIVDLERDFTTGLPDEDVLHDVTDYKSARYSLLAPMELGLLAAGEQPDRFAPELRRYARLVGICGQMRDDYLDLFGDPEVTGKPVGTDLRDGRHTYTVRALLAGVDGADRAVVESALGDADCTAGTVAAVREIGVRHGVAAGLRAEMRRHAEEASALAAAWRPRWREDAVAFFSYLPVWSVERTA
ncbi:polyprenyl synthetase family protein [Streptomyces sp. NPDC001595]|uniref:polyprenyl synthetase family protein n=1 Tax=Streptomyces sp. NPDC001532 TaxID=3154520 RepID=UPI00331F923F